MPELYSKINNKKCMNNDFIAYIVKYIDLQRLNTVFTAINALEGMIIIVAFLVNV